MDDKQAMFGLVLVYLVLLGINISVVSHLKNNVYTFLIIIIDR